MTSSQLFLEEPYHLQHQLIFFHHPILSLNNILLVMMFVAHSLIPFYSQGLAITQLYRNSIIVLSLKCGWRWIIYSSFVILMQTIMSCRIKKKNEVKWKKACPSLRLWLLCFLSWLIAWWRVPWVLSQEENALDNPLLQHKANNHEGNVEQKHDNSHPEVKLPIKYGDRQDHKEKHHCQDQVRRQTGWHDIRKKNGRKQEWKKEGNIKTHGRESW